MVRDMKFDEPSTVEYKDIVIIGGGVSGLSAGRLLNQKGFSNFSILDLEQKMGGNAVYGSNPTSAYPWGAHYIPIPNNDLKEYLHFLQDVGVITGIDAEGLPIYNEYYLCFDPQDRLYINGKWQEGLVPHYGVPEEEKKQISHFLELMDSFRHKKGRDGKDAFAIPVDTSSKDEAFTTLDKTTMKAWMISQGFTSDYLHWYVDYCTRDDFGANHVVVSAWAGIHYFASRKGIGNNAAHYDVLTWPAGNGWLVTQLQKGLDDKLYPNALVVSIKRAGVQVWIDYLDVATGKLHRIQCKQCIVAVPQFVAGRLLHDPQRTKLVQDTYQYTPWMVANLTVSGMEERSGAPLSWDNVIYGSDSLGYVNATHELIQQHVSKKNITYYWPLTSTSVSEARKKAQQLTHQDWAQLIIADLKKVHPNIEAAIEEVNVMIWGHAMVQPIPGIVHGGIREKLCASIDDKIHFAHTDLAGVSIFEEGFYQGLIAAKKVINHLVSSL
jgi:monoamine oxidase